MIRYDLVCADGHRFDSWFRDSTTFDRQRKRGVIQCPVCASDKVEKALMTPGLPARKEPKGEAAVSIDDGKARALRAAMHKLRKEIESKADYVGDDFPEEARRIHYKETDERMIYGEATIAEAKRLHDEGIDVLPLPPSPDDHN